jgi:hypothetical protein
MIIQSLRLRAGKILFGDAKRLLQHYLPGPLLRRRIALSMKLAEQGLGLSQVACVKTLGEPIVDGGEKVTCRLPVFPDRSRAAPSS